MECGKMNKKALLAGLLLVLAANASVAYGAAEEKTAKKDVKKVAKAQEEEIIKNLAPKNKDIAIGKGASITNERAVEGSIALGLNAKVINYNGGQEKTISFGDKPTSSIAIGSNAVARTGSTIIGAHDYTGKFGSYEKVNPGEFNNSFVTTIGGNSYTWGALGTVTGAYSMVTGKSTGKFDKGRGFGSVINGSLNLIETRNGDKLDGGGNALIGLANKTDQSNGGVIIGAGNEITNSYGTIGGMPGFLEGLSIKDPDKFRDFLRGKISGGATGGASLAIGGGNTIDNAIKTQVIGMRNTVNGGSENVLLDGLENKASKAKNTYVIGLNNELENVNNTIILGDNHKIKENDGNIIIGFNTEKEIKDSIIILGNNASATGENAVAIGTGSVATANTVSVGAENNYRKITNVEAGTEEHDAVNFGQLNKKLDTETAEKTYATKTSLDSYAKTEVLASYAKVEAVTKNTENITANTNKITNLSGKVGANSDAVLLLTGKIDNKADQSSFEELDKIVNGKEGINPVNGLVQDVKTNTSAITENKDAIAANTKSIEDGLKGKLDNSALEGYAKADATSLSEENKTSWKTALGVDTLDTTVAGHTESIKTINTTIEGHTTSIKENKDAIAKNVEDIENVSDRVSDNKFAIKQIYKNKANVTDVEEADNKLSERIDSAVKTEKEHAKIFNKAIAKNAKDIKVNAEAINGKLDGINLINDKQAAWNEAQEETNNRFSADIAANRKHTDKGLSTKVDKGAANVQFGDNMLLGKRTVTINGESATGDYIIGLDNIEWNKEAVFDGRAATEGQLRDVENGLTDKIAVNTTAIEENKKAIATNTEAINGKIDGINAINDTQAKWNLAQEETNKNLGDSIAVNKDIQDKWNAEQAVWNEAQEKTNKVLGDNIAKNTENIKANTEAINGKIDGIFNASTDNINVSAWQNALGMTVKLRGNYISSENTVAANLGALDTQVKKNAIAISGVDNKTFTEDEIKNIIDEKLSAGVESGNGSVVIGNTGEKNSTINGSNSIAMGSGNKVNGDKLIAIGTENTVNGNGSGAFGDPTTVNGDGSYSIGNNNTIVGDDNFILGNKAIIDKDANGNEIKGSVALGNGSKVSESNVVSVGAKGNERKIVNVADGVNDTDAVNVRQLNATTDGVVNNARNIEKLDGRVKHVGALSAALAGLHPMQYDPYNPNQLMAAVGSYRDKQAVAVGATHYFNENLMLSAGLSIGTENRDPEVMGNVGVTWKIGKGGETQNYDVPANYNQKEMAAMYAMQTEMDKAAMKNAKLESEVEKQRVELEEMKKLVKQLMQSRR